jgi:hypothetical protein
VHLLDHRGEPVTLRSGTSALKRLLNEMIAILSKSVYAIVYGRTRG